MRRRRYGANQSYRGRNRRSAALKVIVVILAVTLVCAVAFLLTMGRYIQYTDDGVRLVLPWLHQEEPAPSASPGPTGEVIVTHSPQPSQGPEDVPLPVVTAVEVPVSAVEDGTAAQLVRQAGGSALLVRVKDAEGHLAWDAESQLAQSAGLCGAQTFGQEIRALDEAGELYLVAELTCFQDLWMCVHDRTMALTTAAGKLWYDSVGMPWLSPANQGARDYLAQLCAELAGLGFDEVVLSDAGFPGRGRLSSVAEDGNYPGQGLDAAVSDWLGQLRQTLEPLGIRLSVRATQQELTGEQQKTGLTAAALASAADRIWLAAGADLEVCAAALEEAGLEEAGSRLVPESPEDGFSGSSLLPIT